jgi:hypothetical protein
MGNYEGSDEKQQQTLIEEGLMWAHKCQQKHGFVQTLGLLEFISTALKNEMIEDMNMEQAKWEGLQ